MLTRLAFGFCLALGVASPFRRGLGADHGPWPGLVPHGRVARNGAPRAVSARSRLRRLQVPIPAAGRRGEKPDNSFGTESLMAY
jgi:hypothetical protein